MDNVLKTIQNVKYNPLKIIFLIGIYLLSITFYLSHLPNYKPYLFLSLNDENIFD